MITDEQLTLYFYGNELDEQTTRLIDEALECGGELTGRYAALRRQLQQLREPAIQVEPSAPFMTSLHDALIDAATPKVAARSTTWPVLAMAASLVVVALVAVFALRSAPDVVPASTNTVAVVATEIEAAVPSDGVQAVQSHLLASRLQLVRLLAASDSERDALVSDLVVRNRIAILRAGGSGNDDLARVLRAMQAVLEQLVETVDGDYEHNAPLLQQIEFELNAMLTKLDAPASDSSISF